VSTSVNEVLFHGIPDDRPLENGDIVNIDVTVYLDGHHGDCSRTFLVGDVDLDARRLVEANEECLSQVISQLRPGMDLRFIGEFIECVFSPVIPTMVQLIHWDLPLMCLFLRDYANRTGFNIFPDLAGHGIGREFHAYPPILHFRNTLSLELKPGMTFTIEPVFLEGESEFQVWPNKWTYSTVDGGWSAQTEHTVLITDTGSEILTLSLQ
jgi:methionyl aminopeptidase